MAIKRKKLKALLDSRGITAYRLSRILGYKDPFHVYRWIYGRGEPTARTMLTLMDVLDATAEEILHAFADVEV